MTGQKNNGLNIINTRLHGLFDYASAVILLLPWITGYYETGRDTLIFSTLGAMTILISTLTDYEYGVVKLIPMKMHLVFDILSAMFLLCMPWLFPVTHYQYNWPVLLGSAELLVVVLSGWHPYRVTKSDTQIGK